MWFDWFEPLPAFRNENIPAISRLLLCFDTVNGPAKMAHASPPAKSQLENINESWAM
jgi:hypothetical protein